MRRDLDQFDLSVGFGIALFLLFITVVTALGERQQI
jgi:hypothetical protein